MEEEKSPAKHRPQTSTSALTKQPTTKALVANKPIPNKTKKTGVLSKSSKISSSITEGYNGANDQGSEGSGDTDMNSSQDSMQRSVDAYIFIIKVVIKMTFDMNSRYMYIILHFLYLCAQQWNIYPIGMLKKFLYCNFYTVNILKLLVYCNVVTLRD